MKLAINKINYKKLLTIILIIVFFQFCNSPSSPIGVKINNILTFDAGGYIKDIALTDSTLAVAADQNGYIIYNIIKDDNGNILNLDTLIYNNQTTPNTMDDEASEVEFSRDGELAFIMDPLDLVNIAYLDTSLIEADPLVMPLPNYWNLYRSIAIGKSDVYKYVLHSLVKHIGAEDIEEDTETNYQPYSTSIITQVCYNAVEDFFDDQIILECTESSVINDLSYYCLSISYTEPYLTVAKDQLGVLVYKQNENDGLDLFAEYDTPFSVESVFSYENIIFSGLSNDKGCYIALLDNNGSHISNLSIADGYSINDIDAKQNLLVLACRSDGVLLYNFDQNLNFTSIGNIPTEYAYTARIYDDNTIIVGTREGIQIINFGD